MVDIGRLPVIMVALFAFGITYNIIADWVSRQASDHGYAAFLVMGGVIVTLAGFAILVGLEIAGAALACFAASGLPMIVGSVLRQLQRRSLASHALDDQAREALRRVH